MSPLHGQWRHIQFTQPKGRHHKKTTAKVRTLSEPDAFLGDLFIDFQDELGHCEHNTFSPSNDFLSSGLALPTEASLTRLVGWLFGWLVGWSAGWLVCWLAVFKKMLSH